MTIGEAKGLGRFGDTELVHLHPAEVQALKNVTPGGELTINPDTGEAEAFLPMLLAALPALFPALGTGLTAALGGGTLASLLGSTAVLSGLGGGIGTLLEGGSGKEALTSGLISGLGAGLLGPLAGKLGGAAATAAGGAGTNMAANAAGQAATKGLTTVASEGLMNAGSNVLTNEIAKQAIQSTVPGLINTPALLSQAGASMAKSSILPKLGLAGLGLAAGSSAFSPRYEEPQKKNRNPNAGTERLPARQVRRPPPGYVHGGSGGEFSFFDPEETNDWLGFAEGGMVPQVNRGEAPIFDPTAFAQSFQRAQVQAPTSLPGGYGDNGPATMNWTRPAPAPAPAPTPAPVTDPTPIAPEPVIAPSPYTGMGGGYQPDLSYLDSFMGRGVSRHTQHFSEGGFVQGPGDGTSDSIMTSINGAQPAKLSDGEYVIPAFAVSALGNGSSAAGAKKLDQLVRGLSRAE